VRGANSFRNWEVSELAPTEFTPPPQLNPSGTLVWLLYQPNLRFLDF
jgi:hypothetical protein